MQEKLPKARALNSARIGRNFSGWLMKPVSWKSLPSLLDTQDLKGKTFSAPLTIWLASAGLQQVMRTEEFGTCHKERPVILASLLKIQMASPAGKCY